MDRNAMEKLDSRLRLAGKSLQDENQSPSAAMSTLEVCARNLFVTQSCGQVLFGERALSLGLVALTKEAAARMPGTPTLSELNSLRAAMPRNSELYAFAGPVPSFVDDYLNLAFFSPSRVRHIVAEKAGILRHFGCAGYSGEAVVRLLGSSGGFKELQSIDPLLGLLLGYGERNIELYLQRNALRKAAGSHFDAGSQLAAKELLMSLEPNCRNIVIPQAAGGTPLSFVGGSSRETEMIVESFSRTAKVIETLAKRPNFFGLVDKALRGERIDAA